MHHLKIAGKVLERTWLLTYHKLWLNGLGPIHYPYYSYWRLWIAYSYLWLYASWCNQSSIYIYTFIHFISCLAKVSSHSNQVKQYLIVSLLKTYKTICNFPTITFIAKVLVSIIFKCILIGINSPTSTSLSSLSLFYLLFIVAT